MSLLRVLSLACAVAAVPLSAGCSDVPSGEILPITCPDASSADFKTVSRVVENRCGTLDCHGNTERPLRIYGQWALRKPETPQSFEGPGSYAQYVPGGIETTPRELADNAASICGLEPEKTSLVVAGQADPRTLTFVRKPRLEEKHKGGKLWDPASDGDNCVTSWLRGDINIDACNAELGHP